MIWLEQDTKANWRRLIDALKKHDCNQTAEEIESILDAPAAEENIVSLIENLSIMDQQCNQTVQEKEHSHLQKESSIGM